MDVEVEVKLDVDVDVEVEEEEKKGADAPAPPLPPRGFGPPRLAFRLAAHSLNIVRTICRIMLSQML